MSDNQKRPEDSEKALALAFVDGRCGCFRCEERTQDIYRMVGRCYNCRSEPILVIYRAGDPASPKDCPICGNWHAVHPFRLATADEIPSEAQRLVPVSDSLEETQ